VPKGAGILPHPRRPAIRGRGGLHPVRAWLGRLGLAETTDSSHRPYLPTVFTLDPDLRIHAAYNGYWYWGRPTSEELRQDFRAISRRIRADWEPPRS